VLIMASAALAEVGTVGCDAVWRRFDDNVGVCAGEPGLLLRERGFDFFSGKDEGYEDGLAAAALVRGETGQAVAAVDQLFDGEEQEVILGYAGREPYFEFRRFFYRGAILSAAVFQAERRISRGLAAPSIHARSLGPLVKARAFGMTPTEVNHISSITTLFPLPRRRPRPTGS